MTFDELLNLGTERLKAYESGLNVRGKRRPFSGSVKHVFELRKCNLSTARPEDIKHVIDAVLDQLMELKDGFLMSEPRPDFANRVGFERGYEADSVTHNNLTLTFMHQWEPKPELTEMVRVQCWYYPA
jgi:hypothetical protein